MGDRGGFAEGFLGQGRVEQIAFEIGDPGGSNHVRIDIGGPELDAGAEIGAHRPLSVGGDEDQATRRAGTVGHRRCLEPHPDRGNVVPKHLAEEVVAHLTDISAAAAQRRDPGHRVAG